MYQDAPAGARSARRPGGLETVQAEIVACKRCPRLRSWCRLVAERKKREFSGSSYWGRPVPGFGDPSARLLMVGLAPAVHGGNRTGRVFTGDSSGDWLYEALHRFGFARVRVVIALGRIAREAWLRASGWWDRLPPRERPAFAHAAAAMLPDGTVFVPSYHPSRQNTNTGRLTRSMWYEPFAVARHCLD